MENLSNVAGLETLVEKSEVILIFLSAGYFSRWNCLREARQAIVAKKEMVLMREVASIHGGGPISRLIQEFDAKSIQSLFTSFDAEHGTPCVADIKRTVVDELSSGNVIFWHRVLQFKQLSLKMLVSRILQQQQQPHQDLSIPGELRLQDAMIPALAADGHYHMCFSSQQLDSDALRDQFLSQTKAVPSRVQSRSARMLHRVSQPTDAAAPPEQLRVGVLGKGGCTMQNSSNLVLLLSVDALRCEALMDDVRAALLHGLNVLTIHDKGRRSPSALPFDPSLRSRAV